MSAWTAENLKATLNLISTLVRATTNGKVQTRDEAEANFQATEILPTGNKQTVPAKSQASHQPDSGKKGV